MCALFLFSLRAFFRAFGASSGKKLGALSGIANGIPGTLPSLRPLPQAKVGHTPPPPRGKEGVAQRSFSPPKADKRSCKGLLVRHAAGTAKVNENCSGHVQSHMQREKNRKHARTMQKGKQRDRQTGNAHAKWEREN